MHNSPKNDAESAVQIAESIIVGSTPVFLGCKQLTGPLHRLGIDREIPFVTIIGVESETDHLPILPHDRSRWNQEVLVEKDAELAAYLPEIESQVLAACHAIVARYKAK